MATNKEAAQSALHKRTHDTIPATPGQKSGSPSKKQQKKLSDEQLSINPEISMALKSILDEKNEDLATRLGTMTDSKIAALEKKFEGITKEIMQIKEDLNESINYVKDHLKQDIDLTWEYAVQNEQYSRKNNLQVLGMDEEEGENLEAKFIACMKDNLEEEIKPEDVEIIHRIGTN